MRQNRRAQFDNSLQSQSDVRQVTRSLPSPRQADSEHEDSDNPISPKRNKTPEPIPPSKDTQSTKKIDSESFYETVFGCFTVPPSQPKKVNRSTLDDPSLDDIPSFEFFRKRAQLDINLEPILNTDSTCASGGNNNSAVAPCVSHRPNPNDFTDYSINRITMMASSSRPSSARTVNTPLHSSRGGGSTSARPPSAQGGGRTIVDEVREKHKDVLDSTSYAELRKAISQTPAPTSAPKPQQQQQILTFPTKPRSGVPKTVDHRRSSHDLRSISPIEIRSAGNINGSKKLNSPPVASSGKSYRVVPQRSAGIDLSLFLTETLTPVDSTQMRTTTNQTTTTSPSHSHPNSDLAYMTARDIAKVRAGNRPRGVRPSSARPSNSGGFKYFVRATQHNNNASESEQQSMGKIEREEESDDNEVVQAAVVLARGVEGKKGQLSARIPTGVKGDPPLEMDAATTAQPPTSTVNVEIPLGPTPRGGDGGEGFAAPEEENNIRRPPPLEQEELLSARDWYIEAQRASFDSEGILSGTVSPAFTTTSNDQQIQQLSLSNQNGDGNKRWAELYPSDSESDLPTPPTNRGGAEDMLPREAMHPVFRRRPSSNDVLFRNIVSTNANVNHRDDGGGDKTLLSSPNEGSSNNFSGGGEFEMKVRSSDLRQYFGGGEHFLDNQEQLQDHRRFLLTPPVGEIGEVVGGGGGSRRVAPLLVEDFSPTHSGEADRQKRPSTVDVIFGGPNAPPASSPKFRPSATSRPQSASLRGRPSTPSSSILSPNNGQSRVDPLVVSSSFSSQPLNSSAPSRSLMRLGIPTPNQSFLSSVRTAAIPPSDQAWSTRANSPPHFQGNAKRPSSAGGFRTPAEERKRPDSAISAPKVFVKVVKKPSAGGFISGQSIAPQSPKSASRNAHVNIGGRTVDLSVDLSDIEAAAIAASKTEQSLQKLMKEYEQRPKSAGPRRNL